MRTSLALDVPKYFIHNNYILISLNKYIFVSVFFSSSRPSERENTQNVGYPAEWLSQTLSIQRQGSRFIEGACCAVKPKAVINNLGTTPSVHSYKEALGGPMVGGPSTSHFPYSTVDLLVRC